MVIKLKGDVTPEEVKMIFSFAPWAQNRNIAQIAVMLQKTDFVVLITSEDLPVGFARVITDHAFRAFVEDVVVHPDYRGEGIGRMLVEALENYVEALGVERIELSTGKPEFWSHLGYEAKAGHMIKNRA